MIQDLGPKAPTCQAELKTMAILPTPGLMSSDVPTFLTPNVLVMNDTLPHRRWQALGHFFHPVNRNNPQFRCMRHIFTRFPTPPSPITT